MVTQFIKALSADIEMVQRPFSYEFNSTKTMPETKNRGNYQINVIIIDS